MAVAYAISEKLVYTKENEYTGNTQYYYRMRYCPVCGTKRQRCLRIEEEGETTAYICKYAPSDKEIETAIGTCWVHEESTNKEFKKLKEIKTIKEPKSKPLNEETLSFRTEVYNTMKKLLIKYEKENLPKYKGKIIPLYKHHYEDLKKRGLNDEQILRNGYFSVPISNRKVFAKDGNYKHKITTAISKDLYDKFGNELLNVPGFIKLKDQFGNEYITYKTKVSNYLVETDKNGENVVKTDKNGKEMKEYVEIDGYFIPYERLGNIYALQYRLTKEVYDNKGKKRRYLWYSSKQASSGSPIAHHIPMNLKRIDVLLVTEGALKGVIASEFLGFEGLYEAGVGNYNNLLFTLQKLEKIVEKKFKIILALDMDKYENPDVLRAEKETIRLLKSTGHQVAIAHWPIEIGKGIDDALLYLHKLEQKIKEGEQLINELNTPELKEKAKEKLLQMKQIYNESKIKYKVV